MYRAKMYRFIESICSEGSNRCKVTRADIKKELYEYKLTSVELDSVIDYFIRSNILSVDGKRVLSVKLLKRLNKDIHECSDYDIEIFIFIEMIKRVSVNGIANVDCDLIEDIFCMDRNTFNSYLIGVKNNHLGAILAESNKQVIVLIYTGVEGFRLVANKLVKEIDNKGDSYLSDCISLVGGSGADSMMIEEDDIGTSFKFKEIDEVIEFVGENIYEMVQEQNKIFEYISKYELEVGRLRDVIDDLKDDRARASMDVEYLRGSNARYRNEIQNLQSRINELK